MNFLKRSLNFFIFHHHSSLIIHNFLVPLVAEGKKHSNGIVMFSKIYYNTIVIF